MDEERFVGFPENDQVRSAVQEKLTRLNSAVTKLLNEPSRSTFNTASTVPQTTRKRTNRFLKRSEGLPSDVRSGPVKAQLPGKCQTTSTPACVVPVLSPRDIATSTVVKNDKSEGCKFIRSSQIQESVEALNKTTEPSEDEIVRQQQKIVTSRQQVSNTISGPPKRVNKFLKINSTKDLEDASKTCVNSPAEVMKQTTILDIAQSESNYSILPSSTVKKEILVNPALTTQLEGSSVAELTTSPLKKEPFVDGKNISSTKLEKIETEPSQVEPHSTACDEEMPALSQELSKTELVETKAITNKSKQPSPVKRTVSTPELSFLTAQTSRSKRVIVPNKRFFSTDNDPPPVLTKQESTTPSKPQKVAKSSPIRTRHLSKQSAPATVAKPVEPVANKKLLTSECTAKHKRKFSTDSSKESALTMPEKSEELSKSSLIPPMPSSESNERPRRTIIPNRKFFSDGEPVKEPSPKKVEIVEPPKKRRKSEKMVHNDNALNETLLQDIPVTDNKNGLPEVPGNVDSLASNVVPNNYEAAALKSQASEPQVNGRCVEAEAKVDAKIPEPDETDVDEEQISVYKGKPVFWGTCIIKMADGMSNEIDKQSSTNNTSGLLCCGICTKIKKYHSIVEKRKRGSFLCSDCIIVVTKIFQLALKAKSFTCIIGPPVCEGSCPLVINPADQFCQACFAKACLKNLPMKDDVYFKIWRSIPPMSRGCVPTTPPVANPTSPYVGKFVSVNGSGEITSSCHYYKSTGGKKVDPNRDGHTAEDSNSNDAIQNGEDLNSARISTFSHRTESSTNCENTIPSKASDESLISDKNNKPNGVSKEEILLGRQISQERVKAVVDPILKPDLTDIDINGFPVVVSGPAYPRKPLCFLCGSAGIEQLIFCSMCCEPFHPYCAGDDLLMDTYIARCGDSRDSVGCRSTNDSNNSDSCEQLPNASTEESVTITSAGHPFANTGASERIAISRTMLNWTCRRCISCKACNECIGQKELIRCSRCQNPFHLQTCIDKMFLNKIKNWDKLKKIWTCDKCLKCKSCGKNIEPNRKLHTIQAAASEDDSDDESKHKKSTQGSSLMLCLECFKQHKKGSFCPFCEVCYDDNDWDSKMIECCRCSRWIHSACENLSDEQYYILGTLPESIEYVCRLCEPMDIPIWYEAIQSQLLKECNSAVRLFEKKVLGQLRKKRASTEIKPSYVCNLFGTTSADENVDHRTNESTECREFTRSRTSTKELEKQSRTKELEKQSCLRQNIRKSVSSKEMQSCKVYVRDFVKYPINAEESWYALKAQGIEFLRDFREVTDYQYLPKSPIYTTPVKVSTPTKYVSLISENVRKGMNSVESLCAFYALMIRTVQDISESDYEEETMAEYVTQVIKEVFPWFKQSLQSPGGVSESSIVTEVPESEDHYSSDEDSPCNISIRDAFKEIYWDVADFFDDRLCILCGEVGDFPPDTCGRLLWAGANEWIHCNCAIWSSEVWELDNGALQQVGAALIRGRTLRCAVCGDKGATVSCCNSGCKRSYHFMCAMTEKCFLLEDKTMFCPHHKLTSKQEDNIQYDMKVGRKVYVDLDWIHKRGIKANVDNLKVFIGSLKIINLGSLVPISVIHEEWADPGVTLLTPANFKAHRVFWSLDDTWHKDCYTFETKISDNGFNEKVHDIGVNLVVDHTKSEDSVRNGMECVSKYHVWLAQAPKYIDEHFVDWFSPCTEEFIADDDDFYGIGLGSIRGKGRSSPSSVSSLGSLHKLPCKSRIRSLYSSMSRNDESELDNTDTMSVEADTCSTYGSDSSTPKSSQTTKLKRRRSSCKTRRSPRKRGQVTSKKNTSPRRRSMRNLRMSDIQVDVKDSCKPHEESDNDSGVAESWDGDKLRCRVNLLSQFNDSVDDDASSSVKSQMNLNDTETVNSDTMSELSSFTADQVITQEDKGSQINDFIKGKQEVTSAVIKYEMKRGNALSGFHSHDVKSTWMYLFENVSKCRISQNLKSLIHPTLNVESSGRITDVEMANSFRMLGISHRSVQYLLEQLPEVFNVANRHEFRFARQPRLDPDNEDAPVPINSSGCARTQGFNGRKPFDMFGWLASKHRKVSMTCTLAEETSRSQGLPMTMRFRDLGQRASRRFAVVSSDIHGRGLYARCDVEKGDIIIEYAGEVIRPSLTDSREKYYESKGIGCYMFRVKTQIIDATMRGNAARFINHSCEPNCEAKTVRTLGKDRIAIFALRRIFKGEELTYDYKFEREDDNKIPCTCGAARCRKYLN